MFFLFFVINKKTKKKDTNKRVESLTRVTQSKKFCVSNRLEAVDFTVIPCCKRLKQPKVSRVPLLMKTPTLHARPRIQKSLCARSATQTTIAQEVSAHSRFDFFQKRKNQAVNLRHDGARGQIEVFHRTGKEETIEMGRGLNRKTRGKNNTHISDFSLS